MPASPPDLQAAHTRVVQFADKLFAALEDLREAGGLARLAAGNPKAAERAAKVLGSAQGMIDEELAGLKAARRN